MRTLSVPAAVILLGVVAATAFFVRVPPQAADPGRSAAIDPDAIAPDRGSERNKDEAGEAWDAFQWWYGTRAFPNDLIPKSAFYDAYAYSKASVPPADFVRGGREGTGNWSSIGPDNIGGRVLSLAIDPGNPQVVWAGAASGGLWKSTTGGDGAAAWTRVETGFPSLAVSAIAIHASNPQVLYIGTGEMSLYARGMVGTPGARSTYGLGIIKTTDGGAHWQETGLTWTFDQRRAIMAIKIDPINPATLWAATSEGLYKTTDAGATWANVHPVLMAMDVVVNPVKPEEVYVSHGQLNSAPDPGLYKTTDGGATWTLLAGGLPATDFGRTPLAVATPTVGGELTLFAGVSNAVSRQVMGLYKSTNSGQTWTRVNGTNWAGGQAWYDNTIAVSPVNPNLVICAGLDCYRSANGGPTLSQVSYWYAGYGGVIPPGGPEGPPNYVHADDHAIVFDPENPLVVYVGSDGGVFKSTDGGLTWAGKNGGFVTTQIYAGFANGYATRGLALGGLQDNGTIKYLGTNSWSKVFGGDGGYCAIDPRNENVLYEEYVNLNIHKSLNGGASWSEIHAGSGDANFIAPFVISETSPDILYAGTKAVEKTTNGGASWFFPDGNPNWNGTPMAAIGVSYTSPETLCAATGSSSTSAVFEIKRSTNGGASWSAPGTGLPNRFATDISYDRRDSRLVWLTFSGFGSPHVYRSTDAGLTWADRTANLPDIPVQCAAVDPIDSDIVYLGTDLGVYVTLDGGTAWLDFNTGMPTAMVLDLVIRPQDRIMRAATFGNGIYEVELLSSPAEVYAGNPARGSSVVELTGIGPNPLRESASIRFRLAREAEVRGEVFDAFGRRVRTLVEGRRPAGLSQIEWDGRDGSGARVADGAYFVRVTAGGSARTAKVMVVK